MTHYLPQKIMTFFAAGAPIKHLPWEEKPKPPANITGVAELMERLQKPLPERVINKTKVEVKAERKAEKDKKNDEKNEVAFAECMFSFLFIRIIHPCSQPLSSFSIFINWSSPPPS